MLGNTQDSGVFRNPFKKNIIDMKPNLKMKKQIETPIDKSLYDSNLISSPPLKDNKILIIDEMNNLRKPLNTSLNMKMTIPKEIKKIKGKGLTGGNVNEFNESEVIGEMKNKGMEKISEVESMKKSKSGILGVRSSNKGDTIKIYKRNSLSGKSQRGIDIKGILSGEEEMMNHYRSKSQGMKAKRGVIGMHNIQRKESRKQRIYERESLGNFEKQLYESENLDESKESGSRNKDLRNFHKKEKEFKETIGGQEIMERVIEKNNEMAERTVQKVLEHGEKNTKMLKDAFREFLSGFRKIEDSDDERSPEPESKNMRKLRKDLEKEKKEREKLEKSVRELRLSKNHESGGYSTVGGEDWEKKWRASQRELLDANAKTIILEKNTDEMIKELERLKKIVKNQKTELDQMPKKKIFADSDEEEKQKEGLPKYVYIKTVQSRYDDMEGEGRSSDSGRWENSTRKLKRKNFMEEFNRNPQLMNLNKDNRETVRGGFYENKLYKLKGLNTYEMIGPKRRSWFRGRSQRRSKSLIGEERYRDWRREHKTAESEAFSRRRHFGNGMDIETSDTSKDRKDLELSKALENQLGLSNKLISRLEHEANDLKKKVREMEQKLNEKENENKTLRESLEKSEKLKESIIHVNSKGNRDRDGSIGSMWSRESEMNAQNRFHTFNQKEKMKVYDSQQQNEISEKEEAVLIRDEHVSKTEVYNMDADLMKILYSQALYIDESIRINLLRETTLQSGQGGSFENEEHHESTPNSYQNSESLEEDIQLGLEPIGELTDEMGVSDKMEEDVWGKEFSKELFRDGEPINKTGFNMFKSEDHVEEKIDISHQKSLHYEQMNHSNEANHHYQEESQEKNFIHLQTPGKKYSKEIRTLPRNSTGKKLSIRQSIKKNKINEEDLIKEKHEMGEENFEEVKQAEMEEYFSEGDGRYFISGNLILKVDNSGRVLSQKIISPGKNRGNQMNLIIPSSSPQHDSEYPSESLEINKQNKFHRRTIKESINSNNFSDEEEEELENDIIDNYHHPNNLYNNSEEEEEQDNQHSNENCNEKNIFLKQKSNSSEKGRIFLTGENETSGVQFDHGTVKPFHTIRSSFNAEDFDS
jgi:hypothetical protein